MSNRIGYNRQDAVDGTGTITVFLNGEILTADSNHPNWQRITEQVEAALSDESAAEGLADLFDIEKHLNREFTSVSERVSVRNGKVYFDGDEIDNVLTQHVLRNLEEGNSEWKCLVKFWEKIAANPNEHSREHILRWLTSEDFAINDEGDIIGYKGVTNELGSIHQGPAIVDGREVNGSVPNLPGSVITMARSEVQHNPSVGCSVGLHVGTHKYASGFGRVVLQVSVNPRDVVSVPTDCADQKMRVCRYRVINVYKDSKPYQQAVVPAENYLIDEQVPTS